MLYEKTIINNLFMDVCVVQEKKNSIPWTFDFLRDFFYTIGLSFFAKSLKNALFFKIFLAKKHTKQT